MHQQTQYLGEQLVQRYAVSAAKVAERVIVDAHPTADPAIRYVLGTQPRDLARTVHTFAQAVQPQRQQHPWIGGVAPRRVLARLDRRAKPAQVHRLQHPPDGARRMLRADQGLIIHRLQNQLLAIGFSQPHLFTHHLTSASPPSSSSRPAKRSPSTKNSQTLRMTQRKGWAQNLEILFGLCDVSDVRRVRHLRRTDVP